MSALIFHFFSFLNFDLYFKRHIIGNFRRYGLDFVPNIINIVGVINS